MIAFVGKYLTVLFLAALAAGPWGCSHSYPKENFIQSLERLCEEEYQVPVKVQQIGKTIGVYIPLTGLFTPDYALSEEAQKKLEDVVLSVTRATLSTDADVEYASVIAADTQTIGTEMSLVRHTADTRRFLAGDISRNDYFRHRMLRNLRTNPQVLGQAKIRQLYKAMETQPPDAVLNRFFPQNLSVQAISPLFLQSLLEMNVKAHRQYEVLGLRSVQTGDGEALIWVKVRESFEVRPEYTGPLMTSSGAVTETLFLVDLGSFGRSMNQMMFHFLLHNQPTDDRLSAVRIRRLVPIAVTEASGQVNRLPFPAEWHAYADMSKWEDLFYLEEIRTEDFLAKQIVQRLEGFFREEEDEDRDEKLFNKYFQLEQVDGRFDASGPVLPAGSEHADGGVFRFSYNFRLRIPEQSQEVQNQHVEERLLEKIFTTVPWVLKQYGFSHYRFVELKDLRNQRIYMVRREQIEDYLSRRITLPELIRFSAIPSALP